MGVQFSLGAQIGEEAMSTEAKELRKDPAIVIAKAARKALRLGALNQLPQGPDLTHTITAFREILPPGLFKEPYPTKRVVRN